MRNKSSSVTSFILLIAMVLCCSRVLLAALTDSYLESFDDRLSNTSINGMDDWSILQANSERAVIQSDVNSGGGGKSLQMKKGVPPVKVGRNFSYGNFSPTWIRFKIRPAQAEETPSVPGGGIGSVCFDFTGKLLVSDGTEWKETGTSYQVGKWYDVAMKVDFTTHKYDLYVMDPAASTTQFVPVGTNLNFIDPTISSLSNLKFGAANSTSGEDTFLDDVSVTFFDVLQILTPVQALLREQVSSPITVQLQNAVSQPQTSIGDMTLELKSTSSQGKFSLSQDPWDPITQILIPKGIQQATFYYRDSAPGKPILTVAEFPDQGIQDASQQFNIINQVSKFLIEAASPQIAGQPFMVAVTALDDSNGILSSYDGTVSIAVEYNDPLTGSQTVSPQNVNSFINGMAKFSLTYPDAGIITLAVTDQQETEKIGKSQQITFVPASFLVSTSDRQTISKPFEVQVTARNTAGQITPNYRGAINVTSAAVNPLDVTGAQLTPATITGDQFAQGSATVSVAYNRYGTIKLMVQDALDITKTGQSGDITFVPKSISATVTSPPSGREYFYLGEPLSVKVTIEDEAGNPVENFMGDIVSTAAEGMAFPQRYSFVEQDKGAHAFSVVPSLAGTYTVTVRAPSEGLSVVSSPIRVRNATIQVVDNTSPIGNGQVTVQLLDENGNVITSENDLVIGLSATEEVDNQSINFPSQQVKFKNGRAIVSISNSEAEIVTINASSPFKIKTREGRITFGKPGKSGINTLMWREIKDKQ